jgi:preprotein translocase subunit SecE
MRYVVIGVLALAVLFSLVASHGFQWLWLQFAWEDKALFGWRELPLTRILGFSVAVAFAAFCFLHKATWQMASEIVEELAKVSWPTREETVNATWIVIVTVVVCSVYLGVFDAFWMWVTDWIMGVPRGTTGQ